MIDKCFNLIGQHSIEYKMHNSGRTFPLTANGIQLTVN